jgi:hypothetical protein
MHFLDCKISNIHFEAASVNPPRITKIIMGVFLDPVVVWIEIGQIVEIPCADSVENHHSHLQP